MDLDPASKANVIAYNADVPGAVSVSFGSVDVPIDSAFTPLVHTVNVVNKGATDQSFDVAFVSTGTDVPGVTFTVPPSVTVPGTTNSGGTTTDGAATITVTLNADPTQMLHTHDPSIALVQSGAVREYKSEATGYITLTPTTAGGTPIRLVVYALPRPVSTSHAISANLPLTADSGTLGLPFTGAGVDNEASDSETNIVSLLKIMELQYVGPGQFFDGLDDAAAQIEYVGISSDYVAEGNDLSKTVFNFGIVTYGDHAAPDANTFEYDVYVDTSGSTSFNPGYVFYNNLAGVQGSYTNVYFPTVVDFANGTEGPNYFANGFSSTGVDTNIFNTNVLTEPVAASAFGLTAVSGSVIRYQINAYYEGILISQSPILTYDAANPGLIEPAPDLSVLADGTFGFSVGIEPSVDIDSGTGDTRTLNYSNVNLRANRSQGALAIHYHNADGARRRRVDEPAGDYQLHARGRDGGHAGDDHPREPRYRDERAVLQRGERHRLQRQPGRHDPDDHGPPRGGYGRHPRDLTGRRGHLAHEVRRRPAVHLIPAIPEARHHPSTAPLTSDHYHDPFLVHLRRPRAVHPPRRPRGGVGRRGAAGAGRVGPRAIDTGGRRRHLPVGDRADLRCHCAQHGCRVVAYDGELRSRARRRERLRVQCRAGGDPGELPLSGAGRRAV